MKREVIVWGAIAAAVSACGGDDASSGPEDGGIDASVGPVDGAVAADGAQGSDARPPADAGVDARTDAGRPDSGSPDSGTAASGSVLEYHNGPTRAGAYVDAKLTKAAAATLHKDTSFVATTQGRTFAQPLYLSAAAAGGKDLVIVATEQNEVYALDAANGSQVWHLQLAAPVPLSKLPCGNIDPLGVTGTPILDGATRTLYVAAMTTPDGGTTKKHMVYALSADTGAAVAGWPIDVSAKVSFNGTTFTSAPQGERGALALLGGRLYVPYGGVYGDCGTYHGWVVGISTTNPTDVAAWATTSTGAGIWGPDGIASDGTSLFVTTGNGFGSPASWSGSEGIIRLAPGPSFPGANADFYAPTNWQSLDNSDTDLSGSGVFVVDVPGGTPPQMVFALGKDGNAYGVDRTNLGGVGSPKAMLHVASGAIIGGPASYRTATATYLASRGSASGCPGASGDLFAVRINAGNPNTLAMAWCATENGRGSPISTTTDGTSNGIVWGLGAGGDNRLRGFDADTGAVVFAGGGAGDVIGTLAPFATPIVAKGRVFVAADNTVVAFTP